MDSDSPAPQTAPAPAAVAATPAAPEAVSRRAWLRRSAAGLALLCAPAVPIIRRRRKRFGPAPTGWFGHC